MIIMKILKFIQKAIRFIFSTENTVYCDNCYNRFCQTLEYERGTKFEGCYCDNCVNGSLYDDKRLK